MRWVMVILSSACAGSWDAGGGGLAAAIVWVCVGFVWVVVGGYLTWGVGPEATHTSSM